MPSETMRVAHEAAEAAPATTEVEGSLADRALDALKVRIDAFHAGVAAAEREVSEEISRRVAQESFGGEQALIELGPFAAGRIDADRFSQLLGVADTPLTAEAIDVLGRADSILKDFAVGAVDHVVEVEPGGDLRDAVKQALASFGRAYGAARAVEMARAGTFDEAAHGHLLGPLSFRLWNRAERHIAPPLVVHVQGDDCLPAGLGEFLDGNLVLLLVADGPTTPAPLARLITPGTFVMQTADPDALSRLAGTEHPAVALLFDEEREGQARFVHDPDAGDSSWERLSVEQMPTEADVGRGRRPPAWLEELEHLRALAAEPPTAGARVDVGELTGGPAGADSVTETNGPATSGGGPSADGVQADVGTGAGSADPVDRLAAWLLDRADLDEAAPSADGAEPA